MTGATGCAEVLEVSTGVLVDEEGLGEVGDEAGSKTQMRFLSSHLVHFGP